MWGGSGPDLEIWGKFRTFTEGSPRLVAQNVPGLPWFVDCHLPLPGRASELVGVGRRAPRVHKSTSYNIFGEKLKRPIR